MTTTEIFKEFKKLRVLIIGDVMLDRYFMGMVERISPEAPVPVVTVEKKEKRLGGAANVALNVKELGATPLLLSVIGKDEAGKSLVKLLKKNKIDSSYLIYSEERVTTVKTRVLSSHHQMLRYDEETVTDISAEESDNLLALIKKVVKNEKPDVVIYEDYNKGVLTGELIEQSLKLFSENKILTTVDPKKKHFLEYQGVTLFKPNLREVKEAMHTSGSSDLASLNRTAETIRVNMNNQVTMITLSGKGVYYYDGKKGFIIPAHVRNVSDVSGAGDTVIATVALGLAAKLPLAQAIELANLAGGLVCEEPGVVPVNKERLIKEYKTE